MNALEAAWNRRRGGLPPETDAYRLFCGEREGIAGLTVDKLGDTAILTQFVGRCGLSDAELAEVGRWYLARELKSVYLKRFLPDRSHGADPPEHRSPEPLAGEPAPEEYPVREHGVKLRVRPYDGFSTGLFLDQRENRRHLGERARGARVLNLFSYTCAFSVHCARGGGETVSVDVSPRFLDWGRRNFAENGLAGDHRFLAEDARVFLKRAARRGERFGLVIVDPPSFSRNRKGGVFSLKRELGPLAEAAWGAVAPGGSLYFSCNFEGWSPEAFREGVRRHLPGAEPLPLPDVPVDFSLAGSPLLTSFWRKD